MAHAGAHGDRSRRYSDYRPIPGLDQYDVRELDEAEYAPMEPEQRVAAEREIRRRERERARREGHHAAALLADMDSDEDEDGAMAHRRLRRRLRRHRAERAIERDGAYDAIEDDELVRCSCVMGVRGCRCGTLMCRACDRLGSGRSAAQIEVPIDLEDKKGHSTREWICMNGPRHDIMRRFRAFLTSFVDSRGQRVYEEQVKSMCLNNGESLVVSYEHLASDQPAIAVFLADEPTEMLKVRACAGCSSGCRGLPQPGCSGATVPCPSRASLPERGDPDRRAPNGVCGRRSLTRRPAASRYRCSRITRRSTAISTCAFPTCRCWRIYAIFVGRI